MAKKTARTVSGRSSKPAAKERKMTGKAKRVAKSVPKPKQLNRQQLEALRLKLMKKFH